MPDKTPCPRCGRVGYVRLERVITAESSTVDFYCGACEHTWSRPQDVVAAPPPANKPRK